MSSPGIPKPNTSFYEVLKRHLEIVFLLLLVATALQTPAQAQVTGTFFPSALGEIQEGFVPYPQAAPNDAPILQRHLLQMEADTDFRRRPYLNFITSYANQSLVPALAQMDSFTPCAAEYGFFPLRQTEVKFSYIPTIFGKAGLQGPRVFGNEYRGTVKWQPVDRLKLHGQLGLFQFAETKTVSGGLEVLGAVYGTYVFHDRFRMTAGYRRDILGSSLLATTGLNLPLSGKLVGRVKQNMFFMSADWRPTRKGAISLFYGGGTEEGINVKTNPWQVIGLTAAHPLYTGKTDSRLSVLAPSYQFVATGFKYDLLGFGNLALVTQPPDNLQERLEMLRSAQLGQTQIPSSQPQPGVGGYFSPSIFMIHSWNLNVAGRLFGPVYYRGGVGLSFGSAKSSFGGDLGDLGFGGGANAIVTYRLGKNALQEHGWIFLQGETLYRRQVFWSQTKMFF